MGFSMNDAVKCLTPHFDAHIYATYNVEHKWRNNMATIKGKVTPLRNVVLVTNLEQGIRITNGGIIIPDDNMKENGIRARWGKVHAVGPEVTDLKVGDWVLVKHGRWTYGMDVELENGDVVQVHRVEYPDSVELASDDFPLDVKPIN
jgi:co-chaperonin GroES (HSP10)